MSLRRSDEESRAWGLGFFGVVAGFSRRRAAKCRPYGCPSHPLLPDTNEEIAGQARNDGAKGSAMQNVGAAFCRPSSTTTSLRA